MWSSSDIGTEDKILVVSELGGACESWTTSDRHGTLIVIAQVPGESPGEFAERTTRRLRRLVSAAWQPRSVILAVGSMAGDGALAMRLAVIRAVLASRLARSAELVLTARTRPADPLSAELRALAQAVTESSPGVTLRLELSSEVRLTEQVLEKCAAIRSLRHMEPVLGGRRATLQR